MQPPVDFVIITPLEEEREAMLLHLGKPQRLPPSDDDIRVYYPALFSVTFSDGSTGQYKIVLTDLLGMGRVDAANAVGDAVHRWHPKFVLLVGIAGGLAKAGVGVGDVLISDLIADYELQKLTLEGAEIRWKVHPPAPRLVVASKQLRPEHWRPLVRETRPETGEPNRHFGPMCTGDKVIANRLMNEYREVWTKLIGVEMEAGGVASAAFQAARAPGFFMVRGVSDLADPDKDKPITDSWRAYACDVAAAYIEAFLRSGPVVPLSGANESSLPQAGWSEVTGETPVSPLNAPNLGFPSLEIRVGECVKIKVSATQSPIELPWELPNMTARFGARAAQNAHHWKRVHTLSERLYGSFRKAYIQMIRYRYAGGETSRYGASELLETAFTEFKTFNEKTAKLPKAVKDAEHLVALRKTDEAFKPLRRALTIDKTSAEFTNAITVVELMCLWSFEVLTRADRILEDYFAGVKPRK